jgi:DMSO reductase anchor subunit
METFIEQLQHYFREEKIESAVFIGIGIISIGFALYFLLLLKEKFYVGMAYPLIAIALIQIVVGSTVYFRTDNQVKNLTEQVKTNPNQYIAEELPRMEKVNKSFDLYKIIEIVLLVIGLVLIFVFRQSNLTWFGIGVGLVVQCVLMLGADLIAENRADVYTKQIQELASKFKK